jgi:hypothetical protein
MLSQSPHLHSFWCLSALPALSLSKGWLAIQGEFLVDIQFDLPIMHDCVSKSAMLAGSRE